MLNVYKWLGVTGELVAGLFLGYLPSDWLEDRPQVQLDQNEVDLLSGNSAFSVTI